jgi:hypothetical protein
VSQIADLGKEYPPASEALIRWRDAMEEKLKSGSTDLRLAFDFVRLNSGLDDLGRTMEMFDGLSAGDPQRGHLAEFAYDEFLNARRYDDLFAAITPEVYFDKQLQIHSRGRDHPQFKNNDYIQNIHLDRIVGAGGKAVETLSGAGETQRAISLIGQVLQQDSSQETVGDLRRHAQRAENAEVVQYLNGL